MFGPGIGRSHNLISGSPEAGAYTRDGHSDYGNAFISLHAGLPKCAVVSAARCTVLVGRTNYH